MITQAFVLLGVLIRLRQYLFCRSMWLDESLLALNILHRSPSGLLKPLSYHQGAPLGFLLLEKAAVQLLGSSEMVFRLIPFLSGIASVFLFAKVARYFLSPTGVPIAVGLFAISEPLIYYSSETKQYSSDVAVALLLYLWARPLLEQARLRVPRTIAMCLLGAVAIWFSQPAAFVLAAMGLSALWVSLRANDKQGLARVILICAVWAASFFACYLISLRGLGRDRVLLEYWQSAFAPLPPSVGADARWLFTSFFSIFSNPVGLTFVGIAAVAALLGAIELMLDNQPRFFLLVLPIFFALLAAGLQKYPFGGRLLLFIVPSMILLMAAGLGAIERRTSKSFWPLGALLIGFLFLSPLAKATVELIRGQPMEEIRPVIQYVRDHRSEADTIYLYYASSTAYEFYKERHLIGPMDEIVGIESRKNWDGYRKDLDRLRGKKRVWILFAHVSRDTGVDEEQLFLYYLSSMGKKIDGSRAPGASVYLYDLSAPSVSKNQGAMTPSWVQTRLEVLLSLEDPNYKKLFREPLRVNAPARPIAR